MLHSGLQGVLKAVRRAGINIVAIHNHMTHAEPPYVFLHYWGKGPATALARGLKAALDTQAQGEHPFSREGSMKITIVVSLMATAVAGSAESINFDAAATGRLPAGWTAAMTHEGGAPRWEVLKDDTAPSKPNVLAQTSTDRTSARFPLAIYEGANFQDGEVQVRFKPISGTLDQAAGIVWRYRNSDNYYIVRANAQENNVVLYKVQNGKRVALAPKGTPANTYGVKHPVRSGVWSSLGVTFRGNLFTVLFDGTKLFDVEDGAFTEPGKVGLWTKADSVTHFDDFRFAAK